MTRLATVLAMLGVAACSAPFGAGSSRPAGAPGESGSVDTGAPAPEVAATVFHLGPEGDDDAPGTSAEAPLLTLEGARLRVDALGPDGEVEILVAPGTYRCAGLASEWSLHRNAPVTIRASAEVPSPAKDHAEDPGRPVFEGTDEAGEPCEESVWVQVRHAGEPLLLTIEGLTVTRYRGAISVKADDGIDADPDLDMTMHNMVFQRIGDRYHYREHEDGTWLEGKGAILFTHASGCRVTEAWFDQIRNVDGSAGLVHAIYFTSHASRHVVEGNTFHGTTGAMVKLTDFSNENQFLDNQWSYGPHGVRDRWCGADEDPEERCDGEAECPSWDTYFPYERNTWGNIDHGDPVTILDIPDGQTCAHAPPAGNVRVDLGEGGVIYGD